MARKLNTTGRNQGDVNRALDEIALEQMPEYLESHPDLLTKGTAQHLTLRAISEVAHGDFDAGTVSAVDRLKAMRLGSGAMSMHRVIDEGLFQDLRTEMGTYMSMDEDAFRCGSDRFKGPSDGVSMGALCEALNCINAGKGSYDRTWNFKPGVISEENKMPVTDLIASYKQRGEIEKSQSRRCMERIVREFSIGTGAEKEAIAKACMELAEVKVSDGDGDFQRSALDWDFAQEYGDLDAMSAVNDAACGIYGILEELYPMKADSLFNYNPPRSKSEDFAFDDGLPVTPLPTYIGIAKPVMLDAYTRGMEVYAQRSQLDLLANGHARGNPFAYTKYERHPDGSVSPDHGVTYTMEEWNALLGGGMEELPMGEDYFFAVRGQVGPGGKLVSPHGKEMGKPLFSPYEDMLNDQEALTRDVKSGVLGRQTRPGPVASVNPGKAGIDVFFVPGKPGEFAVIPDMRTSRKDAVPLSGIEPTDADYVADICRGQAVLGSGKAIYSGRVAVTGDPEGRMFFEKNAPILPASQPCTVQALNASIDMMRGRQRGMDDHAYNMMQDVVKRSMVEKAPTQAQMGKSPVERSLAGLSMPTQPQDGAEYDL